MAAIDILQCYTLPLFSEMAKTRIQCVVAFLPILSLISGAPVSTTVTPKPVDQQKALVNIPGRAPEVFPKTQRC
jgi:hypothetical protein